MPYRYIALFNNNMDARSAESSAETDEALHAMGMDCRFSTRRMQLFASKDTPTLVLPGRGLLIGNAFPKPGNSQSSIPALVDCDTPLDRKLLDHCWGDYVAILTTEDINEPIRILRDPSGGIPCVHSIHAGHGFVASDVSVPVGLGLCGTRIDWEFITHFLVFTHLRTTRTGLAGISELLPGCQLSIFDRNIILDTAWTPWQFVTAEQRHLDPAEAAIRVRQAVAAAVTTWAELDRALLLELSGGLDSSIVAACLRDTQARVVCCTVTAPSSGTDERPYARHMSDLLGVELNTLRIDAVAASIEFPPPPNAAVPGMAISQHIVDTLLREAADTHSTNSFMSGSGGDTVFCYLGNASPAADAFRDGGFGAGVSAILNLSTLYGCPLAKAARLALRKMLRGPKHLRPSNLSFLNPAVELAEPMRHPWLDVPRDSRVGDQEWIGALVGTQGYVDRMTRNRYRPVRFPLLSQPVVEACLRVPTWMWIAGGRNRSIARDAFSDILPAPILNRRSKGTYVTLAGSLYARNRKGMLRFLEQGQLSSRNLLDIPSLRAFLSSDVPPKDASFFRIFDLCMIENWIRHQGGADEYGSVAAPATSPSLAARIDRQVPY